MNLPCPFCGSPATENRDTTSKRKNARVVYRIGCGNSDCPVYPHITDTWTQGDWRNAEAIIKKAQANWNKREKN